MLVIAKSLLSSEAKHTPSGSSMLNFFLFKLKTWVVSSCLASGSTLKGL